MLEVLWKTKGGKVRLGIFILWIPIKSHCIDVHRYLRHMSLGLPQRPTAFNLRRKPWSTWGKLNVQQLSAPPLTSNATSSTLKNLYSKIQSSLLPTCIDLMSTTTKVRKPCRHSLSANSCPAIRPVTSRMYSRSWTRGSYTRSERSRSACRPRPWGRWHMRRKLNGNRPICFPTNWRPWKRPFKISL
jgi:hypothetical protein